MMTNIEQSLNHSIQSQPEYGSSGPLSMLLLLSTANDIVSPWWSKQRDYELRNFVHSSDHVSGAIYNMLAKMTAIPVRVVARDKSIKAHVDLAERFTDIVVNASQFGDGWTTFFSKFVEDLLEQDNGAFAEVIGPGDPTGPLTGSPLSIANLDAGRCIRTGNVHFPVMYQDISGRLYKLHYTRVMYASQMTAPKVELLGVGFCAVSRMLNAAQNLMDISTYKQEKLGSRPPRQLMITGGGLDPEDLQIAFRMAENTMNAQGLRRFSKTIVAGNRNLEKPVLQTVDMASVPDGFNEKESTILSMAIVAMSLGMDARELFPGMESGASKADALIQHMKQRGKGPGQILEMTERLFNAKFLPPQLKLEFDYQDDAQDRQIADIRNIRSQSRQRNLIEGVTDDRTEREIMLSDGELTKAQFEQLELASGRLEDGVPVTVLFQSEDKDYKSMLSGVSESNYEDKIDDIGAIIMTSRDAALIQKARRALAAINKKFVEPAERIKQIEEQQQIVAQAAANNRSGGGNANRPTGADSGNGQGRGVKPNSKPDQSYQGNENAGRKLARDPRTFRGNTEEQ